MMVKQTRVIFDLTDLQALRLQCGACRREVVQAIGATEIPKRCPLCGEDWEVDNPNGYRGPNYQLVRAMQMILATDTPRLTIRFEIDGNEDD